MEFYATMSLSDQVENDLGGVHVQFDYTASRVSSPTERHHCLLIQCTITGLHNDIVEKGFSVCVPEDYHKFSWEEGMKIALNRATLRLNYRYDGIKKIKKLNQKIWKAFLFYMRDNEKSTRRIA